MRCQAAKQPLDLRRLAGDDQLHIAIDQIPHIARDGKLACQPMRGHAKADALDRSPVVNTFTASLFNVIRL